MHILHDLVNTCPGLGVSLKLGLFTAHCRCTSLRRGQVLLLLITLLRVTSRVLWYQTGYFGNLIIKYCSYFFHCRSSVLLIYFLALRINSVQSVKIFFFFDRLQLFLQLVKSVPINVFKEVIRNVSSAIDHVALLLQVLNKLVDHIPVSFIPGERSYILLYIVSK